MILQFTVVAILMQIAIAIANSSSINSTASSTKNSTPAHSAASSTNSSTNQSGSTNSSANSSTNSSASASVPQLETYNEEITFDVLSANCQDHEILSEEALSTANGVPIIMDGKCVRGYWREDYFINLDQTVQFDYLMHNYCGSLQPSPITCNQFVNRHFFDMKAFKMYRELYQKYKVGDLTSPTADCLGIARTVFCAYQFNFCDTSTGKEKKHAVCTYLCDYWIDRCPNEIETFNLLCSNSQDTDCSNGRIYYMIFALTFTILYFL